MKTIHCFALAGLVAATQAALAQGWPGAGKPAADVAAEHRFHGEAQPARAEARAPAGGQGREWTRLPIIVPVMGGERERGTMPLALKNSEAAALDVFAPDPAAPEARRQAPLGPEGARVSMLPKMGNFYWVSARAEKDGRVSVASTVAYFSEPGPAPTRLLLAPKNEIEIIPQPLPREHANYRESEKWKFLLRFKGQPLANKAVKMETEFGTRTSFTSDAEGMVSVLFPRDFKPAEGGRTGSHGGPRRAKFVLAAEHEAEGKQYLSAFNATYSPDADRDRSLVWGAAFGLLGMVAATPLLRRRAAQHSQGDNHA